MLSPAGVDKSRRKTKKTQDLILGVVVLVWLGALLFAWALPPSLFSCRPSCTAVLSPWRFVGPIRPLCGNAEPFFFCGLSNNLERGSLRSNAAPKWCFFSISPALKTAPFRWYWERLWVGILKGRYINFYWLIDCIYIYISTKQKEVTLRSDSERLLLLSELFDVEPWTGVIRKL